MNKNASTQSVEVTRMRFDSARSFEEVRASLLNLMGGTGFVDAFTNVYLARELRRFRTQHGALHRRKRLYALPRNRF